MSAKNSKRHLSFDKEGAARCAALFMLSAFFLTGCQTPKGHLEELAKNSSLNQTIILETGPFTLHGQGKNQNTSHVNVYIEGDGQAWLDPWTISADPSPPDPMGFRLALADMRPDSILYLARPCQYIMDKRCTALDWTSDRFSQKAVDAYHHAFDQIKRTWNAKTFTLHGYSGGATLALLIAPQRQDVTSVVTFAPLLDPVQWANYHHYSSLSGSLSPLSQATRLNQIPQSHFIGLEDQQVPFCVLAPYFAAVPESGTNLVYKIAGFTHHSDWPTLWKSYIVKGK
ncbi:MAG: hypothetical protein K0R52_856 [Alphaproteobacteria bacterium]|nr:hypothetical protein [Alphaproteobacteria bacterium]